MIQVVVLIIPGGDRRRAYEQAVAEVSNVSDLSEISDYAVSAGENRNGVTGAREWSAHGHVLQHDRRSTVWSLVRKVAEFAEREADKAERQQ